MKNKDLIEILKKYPEDHEILVSGYEAGFNNFYIKEAFASKNHADCPDYNGEFGEVGEFIGFEGIGKTKEKPFKALLFNRTEGR